MSEYGRQTGHDTIEFERRLGRAREVVWDYLVDPDRRSRWFCGGSTGERAGEDIVLDFDHRRLSEIAPPDKYAEEQQATHRGEIVAFEPDERLQFKWFEPRGEGSSEVAIKLRDDGQDGCVLELVHSGLADREMIVGVLAGWHAHLDLLSKVLEGGRTTDFWVRDQQLEGEYRARV